MNIPDTIRSELNALLERARCPYSHFPVAVIIQDSSGTLFRGVNVESAAFPSGLCAEKAALGAAVTTLGSEIAPDVVWIATRTRTCTPPCGSCRQLLSELAPDATVVSWAVETDTVRNWTVAELMPDAFDFSVESTE